MTQFLKNVEVFDTGGRGATTTFAERGLGDVLISFESVSYTHLDVYKRQAGSGRHGRRDRCSGCHAQSS